MIERARTHSDFQAEPLVWSFALALGLGFVIGAAMAGAMAGWWPVGPWWAAAAQAHGHVQVAGWAGLFALGVGFFFLPRLRGGPLAFPGWVPWIARLLGGGALLRTLSQIAAAFGIASLAGRAGLVLSSAMELAAIALLAAEIVTTVRFGPPIASRRGLSQVLPLVGGAFASFTIAVAVWAIAAAKAGLAGDAMLDPTLDAIAVTLALNGFLVLLAFSVAVQTFPLFLRLAVPPPSLVRALGAAYVALLAVRIAGIASASPRLEEASAAGGAIAAIAFVLMLDVLTRLRSPWTADRAGPAAPKPGVRPGLPDRGEYGRFEWAVRGAFAWLAIAMALDGLRAGGDLVGHPLPIAPDAARHALTVGFVTQLIVGMAVRMLPGFTRSRLARPGAVAPAAVLVNLAAIARVAPRLFPLGRAGDALFGLSGWIAWLAIAMLAWLLVPLFRAS